MPFALLPSAILNKKRGVSLAGRPHASAIRIFNYLNAKEFRIFWFAILVAKNTKWLGNCAQTFYLFPVNETVLLVTFDAIVVANPEIKAIFALQPINQFSRLHWIQKPYFGYKCGQYFQSLLHAGTPSQYLDGTVFYKIVD